MPAARRSPPATRCTSRRAWSPTRRSRWRPRMLEVAADDLELVDGEVRVRGVPGMKKSLGEIAHALSGVAGFSLPAGVTPGPGGVQRFRAAGDHLHQRHPRVRGGGRSRDRACAPHALRRGPRLRTHDQSDDGGRPGPWRGRARHRRDALRMDALRWVGPAADRHLRRLHAADLRHHSADRDPSHGVADAAQSARRQGRGRERHHRRAGRDRLRDRGRAEAASACASTTCR